MAIEANFLRACHVCPLKKPAGCCKEQTMNIVDQQTFRDAMSLHGRGGQYHHHGRSSRARQVHRQRRLQRDRYAAHITGVPESVGRPSRPVFNENRTLCVKYT